MIPLRIVSLTTCPHHGRPLLTLADRDRGAWHLTLWLPGNEAERLARVLGQARPSCVAIFELVQVLLRELRARVVRVELDADDEGVSTLLHLDRAGEEIAVACHPADALALAHRAGAPVHATPAVLRYARPARPSGDLAAWLERVRPEDFGPSPPAAGESA